LIALVIIGVIAAITSSGLDSRWKQIETITKLKKVYSTLNQAINKSISENGPIDTWNKNGEDGLTFPETYILPYLNVMKNCKTSQNGDCSFDAYFLNGSVNNYLKGLYKVYLNDGTKIAFEPLTQGTNTFVIIYADINGSQKPNRFGRDIFSFLVYIYSNNERLQGVFLPNGADEFSSREKFLSTCTGCCNRKSSFSGYYCSAVIMHDTWQIKKDYPW